MFCTYEGNRQVGENLMCCEWNVMCDQRIASHVSV